jgi:branched-chain amino acid aminotransferase
MHALVFHNHQILPLKEVRLSPGQAGLFNGWGVFTTMRVYRGRPFAFDRHWKRLSTDAKRINLPLALASEFVYGHLLELIRVNQVQEGCARIYFIFNKVGLWCSDEPFPDIDFLIYTTDLPERVGPVRLAVGPHLRHAESPLEGTKVTSWLANVWSLDQAYRRGFDEVILLNDSGQVAECTAANVFCARGEVVRTPPLSAGCLPGVTRQVLLEMGRAAGIEIQEAPLTIQDFYEAEEAFITSTTREVQAVGEIENHRFSAAPGPVTQCLARGFADYVAQSLEFKKP